MVDAASYLKLGHVFVANMTGNVVFLGFALAGAGGLSAATSLVAIASFLLGAFGGGWLGAHSAEHRDRLLRGASAAQATFIVIALVVAPSVTEPLGTGARYALVVPLALAMGIQNAAAQRLAIPELTTTVLTKTLTGIASETGPAGGRGSQFGRRIVASCDAAGSACGRAARAARLDRRGPRAGRRARARRRRRGARALALIPRVGAPLGHLREAVGRYCTVSVPSMPAIRCPGTEQKNL